MEDRQWCDGHCDCPECEDEKECEDWVCTTGHFKCSLSGLCIKNDRVCDGFQAKMMNYKNCIEAIYFIFEDCGDTDGSDEHDCPCDEPSSFRSLFQKLVVDLGRRCLVKIKV